LCKGQNQNRLNRPSRSQTDAGAKGPDRIYKFGKQMDRVRGQAIATDAVATENLNRPYHRDP